ncbi:multidrug resistance protein, MATE family [Fistulifera solaris]|uniref:Multidrug resistance protein, MATE family n=1 Tax=Fistulifera solaris TaxID=1519565 RepID=A0A1Z5JUJ7_FISSO|nr:multidrug resistance protein, MATE family [Fistulifera solaris]|eukprot:GAX17599.1 multidrug resistance protein, MATE family [Fistulifera solaris]
MTNMNKTYTKENDSDSDDFQLWQEAGKLIHISLPSVMTQFNLYFIFPQSASTVGRLLGTAELAAFSLGSLIGSLTCLSVLVGALSGLDTLLPRAYGQQEYRELGRLSLRAIVVCCALLAPALIGLSQTDFMEFLFVQIGKQDTTVATLAAHTWIPIFLWGVPANLLFRVWQRFLVAQHQPWPPACASLVPTSLLHPFFLKVLIPLYGLSGSAYAIVLTQWSTLLLLLLVMVRNPTHQPESLPALFSLAYWQESLALEPLGQFLHLSVGGVVSLSEWWFWEIMCFAAGSFGVVALCAHTIAYNLIPLSFMIVLGTQIGLSVRMGTLLAMKQFDHAKKLATWTMGVIAGTGVMAGWVLHSLRRNIVLVFSKDPDVMAVTLAIWPKVCYYIFVLFIFGINSAILRTLGMQWQMAVVVFTSLWCFALPLVLYLAVYRGGGLDEQWTILPIVYTLMQVWLVFTYGTKDWKQQSAQIQRVRTDGESGINEQSKLLAGIDC